jgi:hypothetical protein
MTASLLLWGVLFGSLGVGYFVYGKKQGAMMPLACGIGLMVFPYFISNTWLLVAVGVVLAVLPFVFRR